MSEDRSEPARISRAYLRFAEVEARGRSPLYDALARGVAADPEIIAFLAALPKEKRQPNRGTAGLSRNCRMRRRNKIAGPVPGIGERFTGGLGGPAWRVSCLDCRSAGHSPSAFEFHEL